MKSWIGQKIIVNDDESEIAAHNDDRWQLRNLRTGELLNSIKSRQVAKIEALSVDGNTIFWQDENAMLWKQHIR